MRPDLIQFVAELIDEFGKTERIHLPSGLFCNRTPVLLWGGGHWFVLTHWLIPHSDMLSFGARTRKTKRQAWHALAHSGLHCTLSSGL
jgi:hypothetical protein